MKNDRELWITAASIVVAGLFVQGCMTRSPEVLPNDPELRRAAEGGKSAYQVGSLAAAVELYGRALQRARILDDRGAIAANAYNLAVCLAAGQRLAEAKAAIQEARSESDPGSMQEALTYLVEARIARAGGATVEAWSLLESANALLIGHGAENNLRLQIGLLRGALKCDMGDAAIARQELMAAQKLLDKRTDMKAWAEYRELEGRVALLEGKFDVAAKAFDHEADCWRHMSSVGNLVQALTNAAEACAKAGDDGMAAERYFRAGRSLLNSGRKDDAYLLLKKAIDAANRSGDTPLRMRAEHMMAAH